MNKNKQKEMEKSKEKTVQSIAKVLRVISIIIFVFSIIAFVSGFFLTIGLIIWGKDPAIMEFFESNGDAFYYNRLLCMFICITVSSGVSVVLYYFVKRFYKTELSEGTPYSPNVTKSMRKLGVIHLILPLLCLIAVETICLCFNQTNTFMSGDYGITMGIVYLIISYVLDAGIEREKKKIKS